MPESELQPLASALGALAAWFEAEAIRGAIVGGVAASLLGRPRMTRDVDAVVLVDDLGWQQFIDSGTAFGVSPRIDDPIEFAHRTRVLLMRHDPSGIDLDISLGALSFEVEMIDRRQSMTIGQLTLPVITAEDLIIMKALARRPRDIADIESVLDANADLDLDHVRHWLREFSAILEMPEILEDFERIASRR
jgi:hypothetical protein